MCQRELCILVKFIRISDRVLPLLLSTRDDRWTIRFGRIGGRWRLGLVAAYYFAKCFSYKTHYYLYVRSFVVDHLTSKQSSHLFINLNNSSFSKFLI